MPTLALFLCLAFIAWFVVRDCMRRTSVSAAVWIPTALLLILGSRPVSLWASGGRVFVGEMGNESSGSPLDLLFFVLVLVASFVVASSRGVNWNKVFAANGALMLFYLYFAISVAWSGDPVGSLKRVIKDFGLLFVIGVIFSEKDPLQAMRAVYVRCAFVLLPLSVVFIKYFPQYSRAFSVAGDVMVTGVTTQKNSLGEIVMVLTPFLIWDSLEAHRPNAKLRWSRIPWDRALLLFMGAWLLHLSQSKTALLCTLVGTFLIVRGGWLASRTINALVLVGALSLPFLLFFSQQFSSVIAPIVQAMGRNMTFTGRTDIWNHVTANTVNPLFGAGFWNFWGGRGGYAISQAMNTVIPNAHCGYVDIYLDGGMIGLVVLLILLVTCGRRIIRYLRLRPDPHRYLRVRLAFLVIAIVYNLSESTFARVGPIWFTALLMMVDFPAKAVARKVATRKRVDSFINQPPPILVNQ
jgi:exopolysaccharide production protein ExoQ